MNAELEKELQEYKNVEGHYQAILLQKHQVQTQLNEINMALEELAKAKDEVYKSTGTIMVKSSKEEAEKDLKEKKNIFELRLKTLTEQEKKLKEKLLEIQKRIEKRGGVGF